MDGKIFISYRRDDSLGSTGRIYDRLLTHFPPDQIFMDVDTIPPGEDFIEVIEKAVSHCDVLLAVIGRDWLHMKDKSGRRSLDNDSDFVRAEIRAALQRNIKVIPVLVEDAEIPNAEDLPEDLRALARRHAIELRHTGFHADVDRLSKAIKKILAEEAEKARIKAEQKKMRKEQLLAHEKEVQTWNLALRDDSMAAYTSYLNRYPEGKFAAEANRRINALQHEAAEKEKERAMAQLLAQGKEAFDQRRLHEASDFFKKAFALYPDHSESRDWLHRCELEAEKMRVEEQQQLEAKQKQQEEKARQIQQAEERQRRERELQEKERKEEEYLANLETQGDKLRRKKDYEAALAFYAQVLSIRPDRGHSLEAVRQCNEELKRMALTRREMEQTEEVTIEQNRRKGHLFAPPWLVGGAALFAIAVMTFFIFKKKPPRDNITKSAQSPLSDSSGTKGFALNDTSVNSSTAVARSIFLQMVALPGGRFIMGTNRSDFESPAHPVEVRPFFLSKYEVTRQQWNAVMNEKKYSGSWELPATGVSWDDVQRFLQKLNALENRHFRLPSEAEWEFACLKGYGDDYQQKLDYYSWNATNAHDSLHPVGQKLPNAFGLYDMLGNAYEWCNDSKGPYQKQKKDEMRKIVRGGDFQSQPKFISPKIRNWNLKSESTKRIGFRLAMDGGR